MADSPESSALLPLAIERATRRLVPFLMLAYVVSFLDRANVSFAKEALAASRGISEQMYALGLACSSSATRPADFLRI